jgi:hypothetical protein
MPFPFTFFFPKAGLAPKPEQSVGGKRRLEDSTGSIDIRPIPKKLKVEFAEPEDDIEQIDLEEAEMDSSSEYTNCLRNDD